MKKYDYVDMESVTELCTKLEDMGVCIELLSEVCLLNGDWYAMPTDTTYGFLVQERYLNEWSSTYSVTRFTTKEWDRFMSSGKFDAMIQSYNQ